MVAIGWVEFIGQLENYAEKYYKVDSLFNKLISLIFPILNQGNFLSIGINIRFYWIIKSYSFYFVFYIVPIISLFYIEFFIIATILTFSSFKIEIVYH